MLPDRSRHADRPRAAHPAAVRVRFHGRRHGKALAALALLSLVIAGCDSGNKLPATGSREYAETLSAFYTGLAALQVGDDIRADAKLADVTRLAPGEPAGWANWGVLALRQRNFDAAAQRLERAKALAPQDARIYNLLGVLESNRGHSPLAIDNYRKATELDPGNLRALYALAQETERRGDADSTGEFQKTIDKILVVQPDNLAALLESSRMAAKRGDAATLKAAIARIGAQSAGWPPEVREQFAALKSAADGADLRAAGIRSTLLRNVLLRVPQYRRSLAAIKAPPGDDAQPLPRFARLPMPEYKPAAADMSLSFDPQPIAAVAGAAWSWIGAIQLASAGTPIVATANGREVRLANGASLPFPGGGEAASPGPDGVLQIDFNYDFKTDLVLAGAGGVRLFRQESPGTFVDVTAQAKLPPEIAGARYTGAWAADFDADGDLDIILGSPDRDPTVLRNNGDGSFAVVHPFQGAAGVRQLVWADIDGDGNADAAMIDGGGRLRVFINDRQGQFRERALPPDIAVVKAIAVADMNRDGVLDLVVVRSDGVVLRISDKDQGAAWDAGEILRVPGPAERLAGEVRLGVADFDNNGTADLYLASVAPGGSTGALIWLGDETGQFKLLDGPSGPAAVFAVADLEGKGRLDLLGIAADGSAVRAGNRGAQNYHWQVIRPHATQAFGDQRINPFGVGGEVDIRSGPLVQKQPITGPVVHFGLGEQTVTDVVRVVWPNGTVSAEFDVKADQDVVTEQRLKGSCPFLFAFNGTRMGFVKDAVPWGSAIGLRINNLGTARVEATEEWYKIAGSELSPHDGYYDLRITGELWETYYYDELALVTVDHPAGTDIFVDERFVIPAAKLAITTVATPQPIARAVDDQGTDVTDIVKTLDGRYLDTFGPGQYQGVTRDHFVEIDLGTDAPAEGPLYLIARGWMHPTDSSINVAISQGGHPPPRALSLEVPDGHGGWVVANANLGFPAGRKKICLFDLTGVFRPGTPRRLRLRTNLEIYWDSFEWAKGLPDANIKTTQLDPTVADLHYRGYSQVQQATPSSPELPDYNRIESSRPRWRDLSGYYTRYGDVRELLKRIDDRYVIMNSGDEMSFRFAEQPPPAAGWVRDFLIVGDGWIKDGDYNSTFSRTVLPLPRHAEHDYTRTPRRLEDEWVYQQHGEDWQTYHTRYVAPDSFANALRNGIGE